MSQTPLPMPACAGAEENDKKKNAALAHVQAAEQPAREIVPATASITRIAPSVPLQPLAPEPIFHCQVAPVFDPYDIDIDIKGGAAKTTSIALPAEDLHPRLLSRRAREEYSWWFLLFEVFGLEWLFKPRKIAHDGRRHGMEKYAAHG